MSLKGQAWPECDGNRNGPSGRRWEWVVGRRFTLWSPAHSGLASSTICKPLCSRPPATSPRPLFPAAVP